MFFTPRMTDPIAASFSIAILVVYHVFLRIHVRKHPDYTIQAFVNTGRVAWVERMMNDREGILAVQPDQ